MSADELEDYLELQDPKARGAIAASNADIAAGRTKPAEGLLQLGKRRERPQPPSAETTSMTPAGFAVMMGRQDFRAWQAPGQRGPTRRKPGAETRRIKWLQSTRHHVRRAAAASGSRGPAVSQVIPLTVKFRPFIGPKIELRDAFGQSAAIWP